MPIYEFKCLSCGHEFEKIVKLNETPNCPDCDSGEVEKQVSFSAAVSTSKTRSKSFQKARARTNSIKKEKDHADAEYKRKYYEDHR